MKFSIKDFFSKCDQIRRKLRIYVTFTEEILNGKFHFLCSNCENNMHCQHLLRAYCRLLLGVMESCKTVNISKKSINFPYFGSFFPFLTYFYRFSILQQNYTLVLE